MISRHTSNVDDYAKNDKSSTSQHLAHGQEEFNLSITSAPTLASSSAQEALQYQLINKVSKTNESVVEEAVALAMKCSDLSPDAVDRMVVMRESV